MTHEYRHPYPISVTDLLTIHMPAAERLLGTRDLVVLPSQTHLIVQRVADQKPPNPPVDAINPLAAIAKATAEIREADAALNARIREIQAQHSDGPFAYILREQRIIVAPRDMVNDPALNAIAAEFGYRVIPLPDHLAWRP